jgi:Glycosyltransferases, probably involved in cell wall biogenesis
VIVSVLAGLRDAVTFVRALFWGSAVFIGYTYIGYPLAVWALSKWVRDSDPEGGVLAPEWPAVSVVIAVHNEERRIAAKARSLAELDYPRDKLRVLFVSDGSTDGTVEEIVRHVGSSVRHYAGRRGKPYALNLAMEAVDTPIVVFTDVRQEIDPLAIRFLVSRLLQPGIGAVSGELVHRDPMTHSAAHVGLYWRYEKWIRKSESRLASTVGVTGALYAIRREDWVPLPEDAILDDFEVPMRIVRGGQRVVFESRALAFDELQGDSSGERKRKVRTLTGNFQVFRRMPWLFVPWQNPVWFQFLSHKVFRLLVPYALVLALASAAADSSPWMRLVAAIQGVFYGVAVSGILFPRVRENRLVSFAVVFVELNWAAVQALYKFLRRPVDPRWEKT